MEQSLKIFKQKNIELKNVGINNISSAIRKCRDRDFPANPPFVFGAAYKHKYL